MKSLYFLVLFGFLMIETTFCQIITRYNENLDFETPEYKKYIVLDSSVVWQVGKPSKQYLSSAFSGEKVMMTDTLNQYPLSSKDCFYLIIDPINYLWFGYTWCTIEFNHKIDCDTITEGGYIEISYDNGQNWNNIIFDSIYKEIVEWRATETINFYKINDTLENGIPAFTGSNLEWRQSRVGWGAPGIKKSSIDTILIRFCFISDSVQSLKDGWMVDDINIISDYSSKVHYIQESPVIQVIPNPVRDISIINLSQINTPERISVYNSSGIKVIDEPVSGSEIMISTSELPSGFYYVQVVTGDKKMYSGNFVVQ